MIKRDLPSDPPSSLVAYELAPGQVLFVQELPSVPKLSLLTDSEQEVLGLLLNNYDTATISDTRSTSPRTTANHIASIFKKLGVGSRAELAAKIASMAAASSSSATERLTDRASGAGGVSDGVSADVGEELSRIG